MIVALTLAAVGVAGSTLAQTQQLPVVETNAAYVEAVTRDTSIDVADMMAVFGLVFDSLPERVKVYPTENYFYFRFAHRGIRYAGAMRFDVLDRDEGKLHFGYFEELAGWKLTVTGTDVGGILDASKGVNVERLEVLVYRVSYRGKSVVFELNDLSRVKPPANALGPDEQYIGPVFDESAIRFFFIYNTKLKIFHFVLDESERVPDAFTPIRQTDRIVIGTRTGFAFYRDKRLDRKILIGTYELNSRVNNYFDGPFDQLPENFVEGDAFERLFIDSDPAVKGKINRMGHYFTGEGRYLVHPYMLYRREADLAVVHRCATSKQRPPALYYACFAFDDENADKPGGRPLALTRKFKR